MRGLKVAVYSTQCGGYSSGGPAGRLRKAVAGARFMQTARALGLSDQRGAASPAFRGPAWHAVKRRAVTRLATPGELRHNLQEAQAVNALS
jgi:hypothetical protein